MKGRVGNNSPFFIFKYSIMAVLKFDDVPFEEVRPGLKRKILHTNELMTVLLDFSDGPWEHPDPVHSHMHEQTSYIASGEVIFICEGEEPQHLKQGDLFAVPSGIPHSIQLLSEKARLIDSFTPLRNDFLK
ncbi:cupin domain [Sunxiuqinia elliptica]|uniref:Cupin domain n=2 Tax=Sunxiuqinia elliptica TaxID=655355 RepID=A0A4V3BYN0_9BACT|nr:cupin domain [Sunxiuqinia elliptica]TDO59506.1 cupin domain [Sunxiuqinia elliptica]